MNPKPLLYSLLLATMFTLPSFALDMDGKGEDEIRPTQATASSVLFEPGFSHDTAGLFDYDWSTDWAEGEQGSGYGESLTFTFAPGQSISGFSILPGFWKSEKLFYENAAPEAIHVTNGYFAQSFDLGDCLSSYGDAPLGGFWFSFSSPLSSDDPLTFTITSVREGSRYEDCVITELHFIGQKPYSMKDRAGYEVIPEYISASSVLQEEGYDHGPWKVLDNDWSTGWTEGARGTGEGEELAFTFKEGTVLTGVSLLPGYRKSEKLFWQNAAPTQVKIHSGGQSTLLDLSDYSFEYVDLPLEGAYFSFPEPMAAKYPVFLTILSVRDGSRYEDCVLTEVHFYGYEGNEENIKPSTAGTTTNVSEDTLQRLAGLSQLLYNCHTDNPRYLVPTEIHYQDLTSEEKAFALYWLFYHRYDPRVWLEGGNLEEKYFYLSEARNCMEEAFQSASEEDFSAFLNRYCLWQDGEIGAIRGTGDFGSGHSVRFENDWQASLEGEELCIRGSVSEYQSDDYSYLPTGTFRAYFTPTDSLALSGWQFRALLVE